MKDNQRLFHDNTSRISAPIIDSTLNKIVEAITKTTYGNIFVIDYLEKKIDYNPNTPFYFRDLHLTDFNDSAISFNRIITADQDQKILDTVDRIYFLFLKNFQ